MTLAVALAFASLAAWGFGRVGRSILADSARYQSIYDSIVMWLDSHGVSIAGLWAEHFNVGWLLRTTQYVTGRINTTLAFWLIALVYITLGLLEVDDIRRRIEALENREAAHVLLEGSNATAARLRRYMLVRTQMSALTGVFVGAFAGIAGLQFAIEWGVIAFTLNYIPFIGPFIATLFPTLLAMTQFDSWQSVVIVFVCLNVIQFVIGSYIEPRFAGNVLLDFPSGRAVRDAVLDIYVGPVRHLHRRSDRTRRLELLRPASIEPVDCGSPRRTAANEDRQTLADRSGRRASDLHAFGNEQVELPIGGGGQRMDMEMRGRIVGSSHHG